MSSIALAIPHTPWVPARVESMERLREALGLLPIGAHWSSPCDHYREFTDRAPNSVWCVALWTWLHETGAEWALQLQDDVIAAPCFWPALRAMLGALPPEAEIIGLTSVHPMTPEIARRGHRWHRTPGNLVGWAYALRREALGAFLTDRAKLPESFRMQNEDEQIAIWAASTGRSIWHPVPAICDHDTSVPSSYKNDNHSLRRPAVTWRDYGEGSLCDVDWWRPSGTPELLEMPHQFNCWMCGTGRATIVSSKTGCRLCIECLRQGASMIGKSGQVCSFCLGKPGLVGGSSGAICAACLGDAVTALAKLVTPPMPATDGMTEAQSG